jgi:hypothetical protein
MPDMNRSRFTFRLSQVLVGILFVGILFAASFAWPPTVAVPLFILASVILASATATVAVFGRGYSRAFHVGAVIPLITVTLFQIATLASLIRFFVAEDSVVTFSSTASASFGESRLFFWSTAVAALVSGAVSTFTYWAIRRQE